MRFKYNGGRSESFGSSPPGVILNLKPGMEIEVDPGFAYFANDPRFEKLSGDSDSESEKVSKRKK
jgi:hypothetical protein